MVDNLKTFIFATLSFGLIMGIFLGIFNGVYRGIIGGLIGGILYGLFSTIFIHIQRRKFKKIGLETYRKKIIMDGGANHFIGSEGVGGWLYLTSDEIVFKSHDFNVQVHQTIIPLNKIIELKAVLTLGLIPNGLLIKTIDGKTERFVVNNSKKWAQVINNTIRTMNI